MALKYSLKGNRNLDIIGQSANFTNWLYSEIKPFLYGNILEVGSGLGTYSEKIIRDFKGNKIILSDMDLDHLANLQKKIGAHYKNVRVLKLDLNKPADFGQINQKIDSIFALNVLEHIEDDIAVLNNLYDLLAKGGNLVILVPAHKGLFNYIDKAVGHYRRYDKKELIGKVNQTKFTLKKLFYFNSLSILGWYVNGNIFKREIINQDAMKLFDKILPVVRFAEKLILRQRVGISLIAVLEKP